MRRNAHGEMDGAVAAMQRLASLELEAIERRGTFTREQAKDFARRYRAAQAAFRDSYQRAEADFLHRAGNGQAS
jgi:hypothetical protein